MIDAPALETPLRLGGFGIALIVLALLQWRFALRGDGRPALRQATNLGLVALDTITLRLTFPVLAVGYAAVLSAEGKGLLAHLDAPAALELVLAVLALDLIIYWQHRLFHRVPWLWRVHRVHHADTGFDLTTGVRFHPIEIALSMALKLAVIRVLGPEPLAVLIFELALSLGSLWTHTDIALPASIDRMLRRVIVTPSMHRIHHSILRHETDSNYGFHLSIWDRLFGSYTNQPERPEQQMPIGLDAYREPRDQRLIALLLNPFRR